MVVCYPVATLADIIMHMIISVSFQTMKYLQQSLEVQDASLLIALLIVGVTLLVGAAIYATATKKVRGTTLAVLGMQASGKTQLYKTLQGMEYTGYEATSVNEYEGFDIKLPDRTIHIKKGKDIGGTEAYIKLYYKEMMRENEIVIFVFNAYRYLNDSTYSRNTNARFDFINLHRNEKDIVILGSYLDYFSESEQKTIIDKVRQRNKDKAYAALFAINFFVLDIRNKESVQEIAKRIF